MKLDTLELKNFLSFENESFDFNCVSGLTLITGKNLDIPGSKNGCGKSSLINAVAYALFGELPYQLKNENIINRHAKEKIMEVTLSFSSMGVNYKVSSGIRGKSSFCTLYKIDNGDEIDITKSTIAETRKYIKDEIVHGDIDIFMRYAILNSDPTYNYFNLKKDGRQELIDSMFNFKVLAIMYDMIHAEKRKFDKDMSLKNEELLSVNRYSEECENMVLSWDTEKKDKISKLESTLNSYKKEKDSLTKNPVVNNETLINTFTSAISKLDKGLEKINSGISTCNTEIAKATQNIKNNKNIISVIDTEIKKMNKVVPELCDDCLSKYNKTYNLVEFSKKRDKLTEENEKLNLNIEKYRKKIDELTSEKLKFINKKTELLDKTNKESSEYREYTNTLETLERKIFSAECELNNIRNSENPYLKVTVKNKEKLEILNKEFSDIKKDCKRMAFLDTMFQPSGIKKFISSRYVNAINKLVKNYLKILEAPCEIIFDSEMNYKFVTSDNSSNPEFKNFSSGEQMRISMAVGFTFREFMSKVTNISLDELFIDEYFDGNIDSKGIDRTQELMQSLASAGQKIFIVSHRSELDISKFDNVIEVVKENNISRINVKSA